MTPFKKLMFRFFVTNTSRRNFSFFCPKKRAVCRKKAKQKMSETQQEAFEKYLGDTLEIKDAKDALSRLREEGVNLMQVCNSAS